MFLLSLYYICAFCFLIITCYRHTFDKYHVTAKSLTSLGFLAIAFFGNACKEDYTYFYHLIPALFLCFLGDFFLALKTKNNRTQNKYFLLGLASFLMGHIAFTIAFNSILKFSFATIAVPLFGVVLAIGMFQLKEMEVGEMKAPVIVYSYFVSMLFVKCGEILFAMGLNSFTGVLFAGSLLFMISDLILLFIYFYKKKFKILTFMNLLTYYIGLYLLSYSVYLKK